jgi:hypothetical protein
MAQHPNELLPVIPKWTILLKDFLLRLRAWQDGFANTGMDLEGFKGWVKLYQVPGSRPCGYMVYDEAGTYRGQCPDACDNGLPWCRVHASNFAEGNVNPPRNTNHRLTHLPVGARHLNVLVAGYFERRWRTNRWECTLDTMQRQISQKQGCTKWDGKGVATVRLSGFVSAEGQLFAADLRHILGYLVGDWAKMLLCEVVLVELLMERAQLQSIHPSVLFHFCIQWECMFPSCIQNP